MCGHTFPTERLCRRCVHEFCTYCYNLGGVPVQYYVRQRRSRRVAHGMEVCAPVHPYMHRGLAHEVCSEVKPCGGGVSPIFPRNLEQLTAVLFLAPSRNVPPIGAHATFLMSNWCANFQGRMFTRGRKLHDRGSCKKLSWRLMHAAKQDIVFLIHYRIDSLILCFKTLCGKSPAQIEDNLRRFFFS